MSTTPIAVAAKSGVRKWVIGVMIAGVVATAAGAGTFASFNASTSNPGNVFSTGRLELSNTKQGGSTCVSGYTGVGGAAQSNLDTNGNTCDTLLNLTLRSPGDTATGQLALANTGDYDGLLQLWLNGCTNATVVTPAGSGNLCTKLEVYIQEFTSSAYATPTTSCVFPLSASAACSATWAPAGDSINDLATAATSTSPMPSTPIVVNKAVTKYFQVSLRFPDGGFDASGNGNDNSFQNRQASFDLSWRLQEA